MRLLHDALLRGAAELGLNLATAQLDHLLDYLDLLQKWGKVYNLTAVRSADDMLTHHLLDSLAVVSPLQRELAKRPHIRAVRLLDVGSGAGLPGVVIAVCCPDIAVACVDAVAKKAAFVQQVAVRLKLANLHGVHVRVEKLSDQYDVIVSRAFASLPEFVRMSMNALAPRGIWMAMKGRRPDEEMAALPARTRVFHVEQLLVPGLDAQRCLVWMDTLEV